MIFFNTHCAVASGMYILPELCSQGKRTGTPTGAASTRTEDYSRGVFFSFESLVAFECPPVRKLQHEGYGIPSSAKRPRRGLFQFRRQLIRSSLLRHNSGFSATASLQTMTSPTSARAWTIWDETASLACMFPCCSRTGKKNMSLSL